MMVTYPRMGINLQIATPKGYELDQEVLKRATEGIEAAGSDGKIIHTNDPEAAVRGADVVTTDTWYVSLFVEKSAIFRMLSHPSFLKLYRISMGQEDESAKRLLDFAGYQITEDMLKKGGANPDCIFMHCLPRHHYEVDDAVFYGDKSVVFQEAENRKWTILAVFDMFIGKWKV